MTAGLVGADLQIVLGSAADEAFLASNGSTYVVSGTGLKNAIAVGIADVQGDIRVQAAPGAAQSFTVRSGAVIRNPVQVDAGVETTTISAPIVAVTGGDVRIGSPRITLAGTISTSATSAGVTLAGDVTLGKHVTIASGTGDITLSGTVDGPYRLVADSVGATSFRGSVGGRKPLARLATDAGGTTSLAAAVLTVQGQSYGDDVVLAGDVTIAAGGDVRFLGRIDSSAAAARGLTVRTAATTTFGGVVGNAEPLASVITAGGGTTVIAGGAVTTAAGGRQAFNGAVRLARNTVPDAADGPIRFAGTVDGAPVERPGAPTNLVATPGSGQVNLTWSSPTFVGGGATLTTVTTNLTTYEKAVGRRTPLQSVSQERAVFAAAVRTVAILDYVIQYSRDGGATWRTVADGITGDTFATVKGLQAGQSYTFCVRAVNVVGSGAAATTAVELPAAITFTFVYGRGAQYWTSAARQALQSAAAALSSTIVVAAPVNLVFQVEGMRSRFSGMLAAAGSETVSYGSGFFHTVVQNKVLTGVDSNGAQADGGIILNFGHQWAFGDGVGVNQFDFRSTVMHELLHAFGFLSYVDAAGANTGTTWTAFDRYIVDFAEAGVIDPNTWRWDTSYDANLTGGGGGLYFGGPHALAAYGGPVPLYTPDFWEPGSSVSHLDDMTFTGPDKMLMNAFADTGLGIRTLSPVEVGILRDLGYELTTA